MSDNDSSNHSIRIDAADPAPGWPAAAPVATEQTGQAVIPATSATSATLTTSMDGTPGDETVELREEIEETRAELSATLDAIQERLNPQHLVEQAKEAAQETTEHLVEQAKHAAHEATVDFVEGAKDTVREATIGKVEHMVSNVTDTAKDVVDSVTDTVKGVVGADTTRTSTTAGAVAYRTDTRQGAGSSILETIKENPIPTALAAASLGWLFAHRAQSSSTNQTAGTSYSQQPYSSYQQPSYREQDTVRVTDSTAGTTQNTAGQVVDQVQDKAAQVAGQVQNTVGNAVTQVQDKAGQAAGQAQQTAGGFLQGAEQLVKENPIPTALAAASLGWLFAHRPQSSSTNQTAYPSYQGQGGGRSAYGATGSTQNTTGQVVGQVQDKAGQVVDQAQQAAGGLLHGTQDAVGGLVQGTQNTVGGLAQGTQETVGGFVQGTQQTAQQAQGQFQQLLQQNPLAAGAAAVAAGAVIGLIIPETQRESQLMGGARDAVVDRAMGTAQDTLHKVGTIAQKAESAAEGAVKEEAHTQGLAGS